MAQQVAFFRVAVALYPSPPFNFAYEEPAMFCHAGVSMETSSETTMQL